MAEYIDYDALNSHLGLKAGTRDLAGIINTFLPYALSLAGLILFAILVAGGFTMLAGASSEESQEKGKKMVTSALIGFVVIFLAYWIAQLLQVIFQIDIVG